MYPQQRQPKMLLPFVLSLFILGGLVAGGAYFYFSGGSSYTADGKTGVVDGRIIPVEITSEKFTGKERCWDADDMAEDNSIRDHCLKQFAEETGDPSYCYEINDSNRADWMASWVTGCLVTVAVVNEDPEMCEDIENDQVRKNSCYIALAARLDRPQLCEEVRPHSNGSLAHAIDGCYYNVAQRTDDSKMCGKVKEERRRESCLEMLEM